MFRLAPLFFLLLYIGCRGIAHIQQPAETMALPALTAQTDSGAVAFTIQDLRVTVKLLGNRAITTYDIRYANPFDRDMEGAFHLPLADGQSICRYALEVNGHLREGVVVEKKTARVAFENTIRRGIDPGIAEQTAGNHFRTRIYPIPARGTKRVVIGVEEVLHYGNGGYTYTLPLRTAEQVARFELEARIAGTAAIPEVLSAAPSFRFAEKGSGYEGAYAAAGRALDENFSIRLPFDREGAPIVLTEKREGKTYFYLNQGINTSAAERPKPGSVTLLWDVSGSSARRSKEKEEAFLSAYFRQLGAVQVTLVPFDIRTHPSESFSITGGDASALIRRLGQLVPDGGTQLGALDLTRYPADHYLLFSDGISCFGKAEPQLGAKPLFTVSSSAGAHYSLLRTWAERTGGASINLLQDDEASALRALVFQQPMVTTLNAPGAEGLVHRIGEGTLTVAGVIPSAGAKLSLGWREGGEERSAEVEIEGDADEEGVARAWAAMRIRELDGRYEQNRKELTELGKRFSIVTRHTSFIVLDNVEDYVEHGITPPAELMEEYTALMKERGEAGDKKAMAMEEALEAMKELKAWYGQDRSGKQKSSSVPVRTGIGSRNSSFAMPERPGVEEAQSTRSGTPPPPPPPVSLRHEELGDIKSAEIQLNEVREPGTASAHFTPADHGAADSTTTSGTYRSGRGEVRGSDIEVKAWKPDAPYIRTLESLRGEARMKKYRELKGSHAQQPSFFIDAARIFLAGGQRDEALLALSNVAELQLEDAELLRMMAYTLLEMGEKELAVLAFQDILRIREEEPQAVRDLALALQEAGEYQKALHHFYEVITGTWDGRFNDVKSIALVEMNALIGAHPGVLDLSGIDKRLVYSMPMDVRIVLGWNCDNTDIDLWVTDPDGEKCFYSNNATKLGGIISDDMTQGYGPEQFLLRRAKGGSYLVDANLFGDTRQNLGGPITITAELFTDYGRPGQKRQTVQLRVTESSEVVRLGKLVRG